MRVSPNEGCIFGGPSNKHYKTLLINVGVPLLRGSELSYWAYKVRSRDEDLGRKV